MARCSVILYVQFWTPKLNSVRFEAIHFLFSAMVPLTNAQMRALKAQAQRLKAKLKIGKEGLSPQFLTALDDALKHHELVKVKFDDFRAEEGTRSATGREKRQPSGHPSRQCRRALPTETGGAATCVTVPLEDQFARFWDSGRKSR